MITEKEFENLVGRNLGIQTKEAYFRGWLISVNEGSIKLKLFNERIVFISLDAVEYLKVYET